MLQYRILPKVLSSLPQTSPMWVLLAGYSSSSTVPAWDPSTWSQAFPANLHCGFLPSTLSVACYSAGFSHNHSTLQMYVLTLAWGQPGTADAHLLHYGPPKAACLTMAFTFAGESPLQ